MAVEGAEARGWLAGRRWLAQVGAGIAQPEGIGVKIAQLAEGEGGGFAAVQRQGERGLEARHDQVEIVEGNGQWLAVAQRGFAFHLPAEIADDGDAEQGLDFDGDAAAARFGAKVEAGLNSSGEKGHAIANGNEPKPDDKRFEGRGPTGGQLQSAL